MRSGESKAAWHADEVLMAQAARRAAAVAAVATLEVTCPAGGRPGDLISVQVEDGGGEVEVTLPPGILAGEVFEVHVSLDQQPGEESSAEEFSDEGGEEGLSGEGGQSSDGNHAPGADWRQSMEGRAPERLACAVADKVVGPIATEVTASPEVPTAVPGEMHKFHIAEKSVVETWSFTTAVSVCRNGPGIDVFGTRSLPRGNLCMRQVAGFFLFLNVVP